MAIAPVIDAEENDVRNEDDEGVDDDLTGLSLSQFFSSFNVESERYEAQVGPVQQVQPIQQDQPIQQVQPVQPVQPVEPIERNNHAIIHNDFDPFRRLENVPFGFSGRARSMSVDQLNMIGMIESPQRSRRPPQRPRRRNSMVSIPELDTILEENEE